MEEDGRREGMVMEEWKRYRERERRGEQKGKMVGSILHFKHAADFRPSLMRWFRYACLTSA